MGQGLESGMQRGLWQTQREEEEKKQLVSQLLQGVLEGKIPAQMFATPEMQDLLQFTGVSGAAPLQRLMGEQEGIAAARPPQQMATAPQMVGDQALPGAGFQLPQSQFLTMQDVAAQEAEKARQMEMAKFYNTELPQALIKEEATTRTRKNIEKEYEKTPAEKAMEAADAYAAIDEYNQVAQSEGRPTIPLEDLNINGVDFYTAVEKKKDTQTQWETAQAAIQKYNNALEQGVNYRTEAVRFISGLKDEGGGGLSPILLETAKGMGIDLAVVERAERMPAKQRISLLTREYNRAIQTKNKELRTLAIGARMRPDDIEEIDEIDPQLFDIPEEPKPTPGADTRDGVVGKSAKREPTPEEINAEALRLKAAYDQISQENPALIRRPFTIADAIKEARRRLTKK